MRKMYRNQQFGITRVVGSQPDGPDVDSGSVRILDSDFISFSSEINNTSVDDFMEALTRCNAEIARLKSTTSTHRPRVKLVLSTEGGVVYDAFRMANAITTNVYPVDIYASGLVASAGLLVLMSGATRISYEHTFFLYHQIRGGVSGTHRQIDGSYRHMNELKSYLENFYVQKTKLTLEDLEEISQDEHWFDANTALKYGLVDKLML